MSAPWVVVLLPVMALLALVVAVFYWQHRHALAMSSRQLAEQRLIDMTEGLQTGVFQFRQRPGDYARLEFANATTRKLGRLPTASTNTDKLSFFDYIHPEEQGYIRARLAEVMNTGGQFREFFRFQFPDGSLGWILCDAISRKEADGSVLWNGYLFDLTSERLLSESLNRILVDKDQFIAMAGHELKTPVQNVLLAVEAIDVGAEDPARRAYLHSARQAARDLTALIDDLVDVSAMDASEVTLHPEPIALPRLASTVCRSFSALAARKGLALNLRCDPELPERVLADPLRIRQLFNNLIGNAIKYTDTGSVNITVRPVSSAEAELASLPEQCLVRIEVTDTGIGIPADRLPKVFDPFATVGPLSRHSTGLGLAICKRLALILHGRIEVQSEVGVGSTFSVSLPFRLASDAPSVQSPDPGLPGSYTRWNPRSQTLLLVEDDLLVRETLASLLESAGWTVRRAESGEDALLLLDSGMRAIITDQQMPGMDGTTLAREAWKRFEQAPSRPVMILMTGGMSGESSRQANDYFDAVLVKPVNSVQIRKLIDELTGTTDAPLPQSP